MKSKKLLVVLLEIIVIIISLGLIFILIHDNKFREPIQETEKVIKDNFEDDSTVENLIIEEKESEVVSQVSMEENTNSIPILAYHDFMTKQDKDKYSPDPNGKYTMYIDAFNEQLKYLKENGYKTINYKTLDRWLKGEIFLDNNTFMITIDDGNLSSYYLAIPIIEKYDYDAVLFIITGRIKPNSNKYDASAPSFIGDDLILDINTKHKKITLGSHSNYLHGTINGLNPKDVLSYEELRDDLIYSKNVLNTEIFAYPFGVYDDNYLNAVKDAGFSMAFTFKPSSRVKLGTDSYQIPRININSQVSFEKFKEYVEMEW